MYNYNSMFSYFERAQRVTAAVSYLVIASMLSVFYASPLMASVKAQELTAKHQQLKESYEFEQHVTNNSQQMHQLVKGLKRELKKKQPNKAKLTQLTHKLQVRKSLLQQKILPKVKKQLTREMANYNKQNFDKAWLKKQQAVYDEVLSSVNQVIEDIASLEGATFKAKGITLAKLDNDFLKLNKQAPVHDYDNNQLPFGAKENMSPKAALNREALLIKLGIEPTHESNTLLRATSQELAVTDTQYMAEDLQADVDVQINQAIIDKAAELNNDPVEIYNWVQNNIDYIPSYGSMQGSDYSLLHGKANAFDTSSLLIAMYRAANIPARFVYGSAVFEKTQLMNWVGGVKTWEAAANLFGMGGVPVTVIYDENGISTTAAIEHVWVEVNLNSSWTAVDPSFKQHNYKERLQLEDEVPFDVQGFTTAIEASAEINETEGWVRGVDQSTIQNQLEQYQSQIEQYINTINPNATYADIFGEKTIIERTAVDLNNGIYHQRTLAQQSLSKLPDTLRWQYKFQVSGSSNLTITANAPDIVGKTLALAYEPTTDLDRQRLEDLIPEGATDVSQLPDSIPVDYVSLTPQWVVNGQSVISGTPAGIGREITLKQSFYEPGRGWQPSEGSVDNIGAYKAIGVDFQGIAPKQLEQLQTDLAITKAKLEAQEFEGLTAHDITGGIMQSGVLGYLAMTNGLDKMAADATDSVIFRMPSHGTFGLASNVSYWFGVPRNVSFDGVVMDIDKLSFANEVDNNCWDEWVNFNKASGSRASYLENLVPEMMFNQPDENGNTPQGVSAVKAISVASAQGQKIYTITPNKIVSLNDITIDTNARNEIRDALYNGKTVTVHESPISYHGWNGSGYVIEDPETGAGAYKISGGANGGWLDIALPFLLILGTVTGANATLILVGALVSIVSSVVSFLGSVNGCGMGIAVYIALILFTVLFIASFASIGWAVAGAWGGILISYGFPKLDQVLCRIG